MPQFIFMISLEPNITTLVSKINDRRTKIEFEYVNNSFELGESQMRASNVVGRIIS